MQDLKDEPDLKDEKELENKSKKCCKTGIYWHEDMLKHKPPENDRYHVEIPQRIENIIKDLKYYGLYNYCQIFEPKEISIENLLLTHSKQHIDNIMNISN